jgi:hypothetical protein
MGRLLPLHGGCFDAGPERMVARRVDDGARASYPRQSPSCASGRAVMRGISLKMLLVSRLGVCLDVGSSRRVRGIVCWGVTCAHVLSFCLVSMLPLLPPAPRIGREASTRLGLKLGAEKSTELRRIAVDGSYVYYMSQALSRLPSQDVGQVAT